MVIVVSGIVHDHVRTILPKYMYSSSKLDRRLKPIIATRSSTFTCRLAYIIITHTYMYIITKCKYNLLKEIILKYMYRACTIH